MTQPGIKLEYASKPIDTEPTSRYSAPAAILLALNILAGGANILFGIIYSDRLGNCGILMIAAGVILCVTVLRYLSRPMPRFAAATLLSCIAVAVIAAILIISWIEIDHLSALITSKATGPVVVVYIETEKGARFATWILARNLAVASFLTCFPLCLYLPFRLFRKRPTDSQDAAPVA